MPIISHLIGGPSWRLLNVQTTVGLAKGIGVSKNSFYHLPVRHDKLRENV